MARAKYDGLIEAVRYTASGRIEMVRMYERRGPAFSDCILLRREDLIERMKKRKRFATGKRKPLWAGTFDVYQLIMFSPRCDQAVITTGQSGERDRLAGVPLF